MNQSIRSAIAALMLLNMTPTWAGEWDLLPITDDNFAFDFTLAGTMGQVESSMSTITPTTADVYGAQLSFECPWFSSPQGNLRTHFNHNIYDMNGNSVRTFEINPHWFTSETSDGLTLGIGGGLGYIWNTTNVQDMFSAQVVVDLEYRLDILFFGIGARYMWTQDKDLGTFVTGGMEHLLLQGKIGLNFF